MLDVSLPTIVGILTFMSWINFSLCSAEHEKSFITLVPVKKAKWRLFACYTYHQAIEVAKIKANIFSPLPVSSHLAVPGAHLQL